MIFAVSPAQTTLYDQIKYAGSPSSFAWVLPIHGQVAVGLSSDLLFQALDQSTQTTILAPPLPPCPSCNCGALPLLAVPSPAEGSSSGSSDHNGVTVISQQVVGPYETVQLHPNSTTDTAALTAWLGVNQYTVPPAVQPVIAAYVSEGFDFLALRLQPGQGVQAMRPISVTSTGASVSLPLRMVAAGTGNTVGITLWVIAGGRYEPQNFKFFAIAPSDLVWDWSRNISNYTTLQALIEAASNNTAWQIESSLVLLPYTIENILLQDPMASDYAVSSSAPPSFTAPPPDGGIGPTPIEARQQDLATLFPSGASSVTITRMRADLSQAALATDLVLRAAADQSVSSNNYQVTRSINAPSCPSCRCDSHGSSGCAASSSEPPGGGLFASFAGLAGAALFGARARRKRRRSAKAPTSA